MNYKLGTPLATSNDDQKVSLESKFKLVTAAGSQHEVSTKQDGLDSYDGRFSLEVKFEMTYFLGLH